MKPGNPRILTVNCGWSGIKFALYQTGEPLERRACGKVDRIGLSGTNLTLAGAPGLDPRGRRAGLVARGCSYVAIEANEPPDCAGENSFHLGIPPL
jgi:hypothetical protein